MKEYADSFVRRPEEKTKFVHLLQLLVWAKGKSGKSSAEVIRALLHKGRAEFERSCSC